MRLRVVSAAGGASLRVAVEADLLEGAEAGRSLLPACHVSPLPTCSKDYMGPNLSSAIFKGGGAELGEWEERWDLRLLTWAVAPQATAELPFFPNPTAPRAQSSVTVLGDHCKSVPPETGTGTSHQVFQFSCLSTCSRLYV